MNGYTHAEYSFFLPVLLKLAHLVRTAHSDPEPNITHLYICRWLFELSDLVTY